VGLDKSDLQIDGRSGQLRKPTGKDEAQVTHEPVCYDLIATDFGPVAIVWWTGRSGPRIRQVFLAMGRKRPEAVVRRSYPGARCLSVPAIATLGRQFQRFLRGEAVTFNLKAVALEVCGEFQQRVLLAEYGIPRGRVSTYGRIAKKVGAGGASRAVGNALAGNPFPIIIPCHRAVRSDGSIGGYQGGAAMKRALLAMEGIKFTKSGKVLMRRVHY
jgi:methylated-DNA-[protein]-cysteine S-methyltransferase